jgi:hypothetical protein
MRTLTVALTAAVALLAAASPAAQAGTQTIGQTGGDPAFFCSPDATRVAPDYVIPHGGGSITSFSFDAAADNNGQTVDFLVLRPQGGTSYEVVGKSGVKTLTNTVGVQTFPVAAIPAQEGDLLGHHSVGALDNCAHGSAGSYRVSTGPDPDVGDVVTISVTPGCSPCSLNESAQLDVPPTAAGFMSTGFSGGMCGGRPANIGAGVTNTDTIPHSYRLYGAWYENGTLRGSVVEDVTLGPSESADRTIFSGTMLTGKHGARAIWTVGRLDGNVREFRLELPFTILKCAAAPAATVALTA